MSDSDESGVTINGGFPGPFLRGLSDIGSPRADDQEESDLGGGQGEEDDDKDPEEDPVDYSADGGDDRDDEDEPSKEDEDNDVDMEANGDEEEEEHPAPEDLFVLLFLLQVPTPVWSDAEVASLLAILLHPSSPLSTP
ncbi:hypothetical protein Tco_1310787 [Tanacetum coccineum]